MLRPAGYAGGAPAALALAAVLLAGGCSLVTDVSIAPGEPVPPPRRTPTVAPGTVKGPPVPSTTTPALVGQRDRIPYPPQRQSEMAAYAQRHYGVPIARLEPSLVVLHFTESEDYAAVRSHFASNEPSLGELPGVCAHYVVEQDGTVHELVPPELMCRHAVGLNHRAIGIELVQSSHGRGPVWAAGQILARRPQMASALELVRQLQARFGIGSERVIGHGMANEAPEFLELRGWRNDHVDWQEPEVEVFRARLRSP